MGRDRIIIFVLVGVMLFSAVATGLLFLSQSDSTDNQQASQTGQSETDESQVCQASPDVAAQPGAAEGEWPATAASPLSSLEITDLREGEGAEAALGNCITVHYRLSLADGTPIEGNNTFEDGSPIAFELAEGSLIEGWIQGIPGLKEGGFRRLLVPAELAYGQTERPGIPAGSDLIFDVELVKIEF
jgi:FKBP-type peptidyl-prolyl cis-trans isomerase